MRKSEKTMGEKKIKIGNILKAFEEKQKTKKILELRSGDTVKVHAKIKEGDKERIQVFEGIVTRVTKGNHRLMLTVRKISFGVGVERIFPLYSPTVERVERLSHGHVRRARLYHLRERKGKQARIESEMTEGETESLGPVASGPVVSSPETKEKKDADTKAVTAHEVVNIRKT